MYLVGLGVVILDEGDVLLEIGGGLCKVLFLLGLGLVIMMNLDVVWIGVNFVVVLILVWCDDMDVLLMLVFLV